MYDSKELVKNSEDIERRTECRKVQFRHFLIELHLCPETEVVKH